MISVLQGTDIIEKTPDAMHQVFFLVGEGGFEPPKLEATDLQSAPFGHSGILPYVKPTDQTVGFFWSWWTDLNPRPADYKSAALPTELHQRVFCCASSTA